MKDEENDRDYDWLLTHICEDGLLPVRSALSEKVARLLKERVEAGALPYTLGVFGGWGTGKTTFLAMVAKRFENSPDYKVIYFNSWKYAGLMEIVPSLIYKILRYGVAKNDQDRKRAAVRVLLSLGKEYSDRFGEWAQDRIGVNPVGLFKDVYKIKEIVDEGEEAVRPELLEAYYNQVDKAQDALAEVLGQVTPGKAANHPVIVLIDELDRCDPDEAFIVIKQMRVLFAMRRLPVAFVVCANPDPIGLAIKHRYGLDSASSDYEARRILEKFVDAYEELSEPANIGNLVSSIWAKDKDVFPWVLATDAENGDVGYTDDSVRNVQAFDLLDVSNPQYSNLRVLRKSFDHVKARAGEDWDRRLLWTAWHLEIVSQIDPTFRREICTLSRPLSHIVNDSYARMAGTKFHFRDVKGATRLICESEKGATLFAIFRSWFWENARPALADLNGKDDPQSRERTAVLSRLLANPVRVDFIAIMSLLWFTDAPGIKELAKKEPRELPDVSIELNQGLRSEFGWLLANY